MRLMANASRDRLQQTSNHNQRHQSHWKALPCAYSELKTQGRHWRGGPQPKRSHFSADPSRHVRRGPLATTSVLGAASGGLAAALFVIPRKCTGDVALRRLQHDPSGYDRA